MARPRNPNPSRPARASVPPYTDQLRKFYEFASTERLVRSGGITETLTNADIMLRKQFEAGVAGKTLAQRDYLHQVRLAEQARREHLDAECAFWSRVKEAHQRQIDQDLAAKKPRPRVLPHPDDIIIDWSNGVRIIGPVDEEALTRYEHGIRVRDALFVQQAMEDCVNGVRIKDRPTLGAPGLLAFFLNELLPPSLRMSEFDWIHRVDRLSRLSQRDVLKACRKAWRSAGVTVVRGQTFGSREKLMPMLHTSIALTKAAMRQKADPQGYEASIEACAMAMMEFRNSAQRVKAKASGRHADALHRASEAEAPK
jgi:hypothetical protein